MTRRHYNITRCNILQKDIQSSQERGKHPILSHTNIYNTKPVILKYSLSYLLEEKHEDT